MITLDTRTLNDEELERLYYQAGLVEVAAIYARTSDATKRMKDLEELIEASYPSEAYKKLEKLIEHLQEHIRTADTALTELYDLIYDAPKLNRKDILAAVADIELDPDTEP